MCSTVGQRSRFEWLALMNKSIKSSIFGALICFLVNGCASSSKDITGSYVSPLQYEMYSCDQLSMEAQRVSARASQVVGVQDDHATNDAVAVGIGTIIFWPSLFFMKGDGQTAAELARLRGEFEAIEKTSITKNCSFRFQKSITANADQKSIASADPKSKR